MENHPENAEKRAVHFMVRVARALHIYGAPANRLEAALTQMSARFGLEGQFFSTPTSIFIAFGPAEDQRMMLERVEPGDVNLEKLSELDELLDEVASASVSPEEGVGRIAEIVARPNRYGWLSTTLAHILVAASAAVFLGGGRPDVVTAAVAGMIVGFLIRVMGNVSATNRLLELTAASLVTFFAAGISALVTPVSILLVAASALIVMVPGLNLTVAISELATRHLVSGSSRFAGSLVVFVTLAFGVGLGSQLGAAVFDPPELVAAAELPRVVVAIALLSSTWALTIFFRARPNDFVWIFLIGTLALAAGRLGVHFLGLEVGTMVAALFVGLGSNLFSRLRNRPVAIAQMPGMILLVPGVIGFRSASALVREDTIVGVQTAFSVVLVAVALVTGLLIANAVLPARRNL